MRFTKHSEVEGKHAILSASKPHWINYDEEKLLSKVENYNAAAHGTRLHEWASETIKLGRKQPNTAQTLNLYINDCIGYRMEVEVVLFYSWYAFGTADAIQFREEEDGRFVLRIFDLKTGVTKASFTQLLVYAALFCLEYKVKPMTIEYDLRIYQNDEVFLHETDPEEVAYVMDRIKTSDKLIQSYQEGV